MSAVSSTSLQMHAKSKAHLCHLFYISFPFEMQNNNQSLLLQICEESKPFKTAATISSFRALCEASYTSDVLTSDVLIFFF